MDLVLFLFRTENDGHCGPNYIELPIVLSGDFTIGVRMALLFRETNAPISAEISTVHQI